MADNVNQNVAILSLMAKLEDNSKEISAQAKKMIGKVEKTAGTIEFGANTKEIQNAIERINKLIDGKLKGIDLTKQFGSILKVFSNAESSAEDYLNILDKVHNELFSISKLPKNSLDLMGNFSPKQVEQVLKIYDKLINKQEQYSKKLEESRKKAQSIEAKSLISLKRDYKGNTSYDTASSDTVIESLTKQIGLENNITAKRDIKEYSQLLSIFNLLQDRKKELAKIDTVKAAEEEVQINKSLLNIVNEIVTKEKRLSTAFGAKDLLSSSLEGFDTGEINRSILRSVDEYSTRASKVVKDSIKQLQNELDQTILDYSQKNVDKMVSAQEKASEKVKARIDKRSSSITSSTKGSQDGGIENIGDVAQDASENVQKLDNALENIGDDSGSNELDLWAKSAENLKEEFADVIKYAVDAETALKEVKKIIRKEEAGKANKQDDKDLVAFAQRLTSLNDNKFKLNNEQKEWVDMYKNDFTIATKHVAQMTEKQLKEIEKLKVAQKELSEQPMSDSSSTSMMEKQIEETTEAVEKLEQSEKEVRDGAEQLEQKLSNSFSISQSEVSELIALVQDLANKLGSADFAENLFKNQNELKNTFKNIADEFGDSLNSNINEFADNLDSTTKEEFNFDNIRNELLSIVQQFQNSLQTVGLSSTQLDDAYKMIKGWNDASNIMVGSGKKDAERAALIEKKTGKVSNSYLYDKEGEFSGQILDKLNKLSAGVSGEISEIYDTWLHSHPFKKVLEGLKTIGSDVGFSVDDFNVYMNKYLEKGITNMMVTSNGKYTNIDWTGIVDKEVIKRVKENFAKSDIFVNGKFKGSLVESRDVHDFDKQTELINTEIIKAMSSAGIKDASSRLSTGNIEDLKVDVAQLQTEMNETQNDAQILYEVLDKISNALNEINAYGGFKFDGLDSLVASLEEVNRLLSEISNSIKANTNNIPSVSSIQPQIEDYQELRNELEQTEQQAKETATALSDVNQSSVLSDGATAPAIEAQQKLQDELKETQKEAVTTQDILEDTWKYATKVQNPGGIDQEVIDWKANKGDDVSGLINREQAVENLNSDLSVLAQNGSEGLNKLKERANELASSLSSISEAVNRISKMSSIKNIPFDNFANEATEISKRLANLYDEGIADSEEFVALQYKIMKLFDKEAESAGGVKGSGASSMAELRAWIMDSWTRKNADFDKDTIVDILWGGKSGSTSIIDETNGKLISMKDIVAQISNYGQHGWVSFNEDTRELKELNAIIEYVEKNLSTLQQMGQKGIIPEANQTPLSLVEESSGQLAMFEGVEEQQKEIRQSVEQTNDSIEGQIDLFEYLSKQEAKSSEQIKDTFDVGSTSASTEQNTSDIKAETDAIKKNTNALKENAQAHKKKSETKEDTSDTRIHDVSKAWTAAIRENKVFDDNQTRLAIKNYEELIGKLDEYYALLAKEHKGQLTSDETALLNEFRDQIDKASKSIDEFKGKEKDLKDVVKKFNTRISEFDNDSGLIGLNGRNNTFESLSQKDVVSTKTNKYEAKLKDLEIIILKIRKLVPIDVNNDEDVKELKDLNVQFDKLANNLSSDEYNPAKKIDIDALSGKISDTLHKNTAAPKEIRMQLEGLIAKLKEFGLSEADIQKVREEFVKLNSQMKATGKTGDSLGTKITKKFKDVAAYFATYVSIQDAIQVIRQGFETIKEYDTALTEMNKVSDESIQTLKEFQKESFGLADSIGTTAQQIQNSTADWMRLGKTTVFL